jgi:hypothetical protein
MLVQYSRFKQSKEVCLAFNTGPICCPETSVTNYESTSRNISKERRSELNLSGNVKFRLRVLNNDSVPQIFYTESTSYALNMKVFNGKS